jgi:hypothetical protein
MPIPKQHGTKRLLVGIVLDRSSSMGSIVEPTISGTNEQFSALRDSDDAANTFVAFSTFNNKVTPVFKNDDGSAKLVPAVDLKDIDRGDYHPSGMTAMRDGVNDMIDLLSAEAKKVDDVLIVVISDGMENASKTDSDVLASKVKELQDDGWNFTYIGANQDLTQVAADTGFHVGNMMTFDANTSGTTSMNTTVSSAIGTYTATRSARAKKGVTGRVSTQSLYDMPDPDVELTVENETTTATDADEASVS